MESIQAVQTKDYIIQAIRDEILSGSMVSGEELTQENIAEQLGVSRMPVREAFQALAQEGFLIRLPNRHVQVAGLDKKQVTETFLMAAAMEAELYSFLGEQEKELVRELAGRVVQLTEKTEQSEAEGQNMQIGHVSDTSAREAELELHRTIGALVHNPYMQQLFQRLLDGYIAYAVLHLNQDGERNRMMWEEIRAAMEEKERAGAWNLKLKFQNYYSSLAEALLGHRKENS